MTDAPKSPATCLRCQVSMRYLGVRNFHESLGIFPGLPEGRENYDAYACPRCGHVDMFINGIGDELRGDAVPSVPAVIPPADKTPTRRIPEWKCPSCGEPVPGNFDVCWKCDARRPGAPPEDEGDESVEDPDRS